jgi:hypothetical protein
MKIPEREKLIMVNDHVLGKSAGAIHAQGIEILAVQRLIAPAIVAMAAKLRVVRAYPVSDLEIYYILPYRHNFAYEFVPGDKRIFSHELPMMQVDVSPTYPARFNFQ